MSKLNKKNVEDLNVKGKHVLVRVDFNVPMKDGKITSDKRIVGALPTIKYLMDKGAKEVYAFLSHAILKSDAVERIEASPIKQLVTTDTVDNSDVLGGSTKIKIVSAAPLFAEAVRTIHERQPMSYMFGHLPERLLNMSFEGLDV